MNRVRTLPGTADGTEPDDSRWPELLRIAAATFAEHGYRSTSLQDIAEQFGVLKGSLYHYIRSKDDLLYEIMRSVLTLGVAGLHSRSTAGGPAVERLQAVVRGHIRYLLDNLAETSVVLHEYTQLPPVRRAGLPVGEFRRVFAGLIAEGQREGSIKPALDPELAAMALLGAANHTYRWYRPSGGHPPEQIAEQFAEILVSGLIDPAWKATS